jgi:hypothetical protein
MKLRSITEKNIKGSQEVVRRTADALGDMIEFAYENLDPNNSRELQTLNAFLDKPTPQTWQQSKWIIDSLIKQTDDPRTEIWAGLKGVTSPTIAASVYDIDPSKTKGTPLGDVSLSRRNRDNLKQTLGPEGYISSLANAGGEVSNRELKQHLKTTAKDSKALTKAAKNDLPNLVTKKPPRKF